MDMDVSVQQAKAVEIKGVSKVFGGYQALKPVTFDIRENEFFTLLGPSGCGKTTLLRMIAGFEQPTMGAIDLDGESLIDRPAHLRPTNMVFQSYAIFPHLNVRANIAYGLRKQRLPRNELRQRVEQTRGVQQP